MYAVVFMAQLRFREHRNYQPHMFTIAKSFTGYCVLTTFHILAVDDLFIATKRSNNIHIFLAVLCYFLVTSCWFKYLRPFRHYTTRFLFWRNTMRIFFLLSKY